MPRRTVARLAVALAMFVLAGIAVFLASPLTMFGQIAVFELISVSAAGVLGGRRASVLTAMCAGAGSALALVLWWATFDDGYGNDLISLLMVLALMLPWLAVFASTRRQGD